MKSQEIAIIGAGFTGLTTAYELSKKGIPVTIFEKESSPGGLAVGFNLPDSLWTIEKHYHHIFTNDTFIINLAKEIGMEKDIIFPHSETSLYINGQIFPFNTPKDILSFPPLHFPDRFRLGAASIFLKMIPPEVAINFEKYTSSAFTNMLFGKNINRLIWDPLLSGKFSVYKDVVNAAWFWARIKKRTLTLGYIAGGFQTLAENLAQKIQKQGGKILYKTPFSKELINQYDKIIVTTPTFGFLKLFPHLPQKYRQNLESIPHLHALNLFLILKDQFFQDGTYWLNINDRSFPFIAVVEHTNFIDPNYYGGKHLLYVGNYLPQNHPYLKMSEKELLNLFLPFLQKINPELNLKLKIE
ncbi:FAD-dependent oxidoreductase, partial [Candidatus Gottesmanbacteria bacterium]|nr:FAD-dependent oxidoreductase [Candidatus Gottesmanbacteria bacterium]